MAVATNFTGGEMMPKKKVAFIYKHNPKEQGQGVLLKDWCLHCNCCTSCRQLKLLNLWQLQISTEATQGKVKKKRIIIFLVD